MLIRKPINCMQSLYHFENQERIRSFESYVNEVLAKPDTKYMRYPAEIGRGTFASKFSQQIQNQGKYTSQATLASNFGEQNMKGLNGFGINGFLHFCKN